MRRRDLGALALLGALSGLVFGPSCLAGRVFFWGDLIYIHHPWKALIAELLQKGALPLWDPYAYAGMPLAANMQSAVWYPGSLPFYLFSFANAVIFFDAAHFWLVGALTFLWLRQLRMPRGAAFGGAALFMLGGGLVSRIPFLNHVSTIAHFPALLLSARSPALFALAAASAFFSGYPPMLAGEVPAALLLAILLGPGTLRWSSKAAAGAACACLGLTACLLLPAVQLALDSRRSQGIEEEESLRWSYSPADLIQFTAPPVIRAAASPPAEGEPPAYCPTLSWWKTSYLGIGGCAAALSGLLGLAPALVTGASAYLGAVLLLILGATNPASHWVWTHVGPLRYVRYPGNMAYLAFPLIAWLAASGLGRLKKGRAFLAALILAVELLVYARDSQPLVDKSYYTDPGPLVRLLRTELHGHRYLASPLALRWQHSIGFDLKHRLYGVINIPYRLRAVGNFGEPLVPASSYAFMDFLYSRGSLAEVVPWLGWSDVKVLFTKDLMRAPGLRYLGDALWQLYEVQGPVAGAFWFGEAQGALIPAGLAGPLPNLRKGVPLAVRSPREDRYAVSGVFERPGWLYVCEPRAPGWSARIGDRVAASEPALLAFQKLRVPAGSWEVRFRYDPLPWRAGRALTLAVLSVLGAYWYNRARRGFAK